jgi:hypothetical protein
MKPVTRPFNVLILALLAALMLATRFKHFGDALHLPDAAMALFFLGGLWLRAHRGLLSLLLLAVAIDELSVHYLGVSDFCMTPAYAFMPLAYALLWYAGRACSAGLAPRPVALLGVAAVALAAAVGSFMISNGAFYWLGGRYAQPNLAQYLQRLWQWGPLFVGVSMGYVATGLALYAGLAHRRAVRAA